MRGWADRFTSSGRRAFPRGIGVASTVLAGGWIALWLLWPMAERDRASARTPASTVFRFIGNTRFDPETAHEPLVLGGVSGMRVEEMAGVTNVDSGAFVGRRERLGVRLPVDNVPEAGALQLVPRPSERSGGYVSHFQDSPALPQNAAGSVELRVETTGELRSRGFALQGMPAVESVASQGKRWVATATVECGKDGSPRNVFLERSSGDPQVDRHIVRELYRGRLLRPGGACAGQVILSYGTP